MCTGLFGACGGGLAGMYVAYFYGLDKADGPIGEAGCRVSVRGWVTVCGNSW
mgnify:CR=1 FL=1|jgi:hypothetical protein